jgi:hypothetical protein
MRPMTAKRTVLPVNKNRVSIANNRLPVWRNGRRTGLKIFKIALSDRFSRLLLTRVSAFIYKPIFNFSLISPHP